MAETKGVRIFISYRRNNGREIARNIYERLSMLGYNTFFDYNSMRDGMFNKQIFKAIDQASDFIFILTPQSLERCKNVDDWVRVEIEYAIEKGKNIILLAPEETFKGFPSYLPNSIASIKHLNILFLNQNYYEESIHRLVKKLSPKPIPDFLEKLAMMLLIAVLLIIALLIVSRHRNAFGDVGREDGCIANLSLMRYRDLNLIQDNIYPTELTDLFYYEDSISVDSQYFIYPKSDYMSLSVDQTANVQVMTYDSILPIIYHSPVVRLKLRSVQSKTVVFNCAEIEIEEYKVDDVPLFRMVMNENKLRLINEGWKYWQKGELYYSWLYTGESFVNYETIEEFNYFEDWIDIPVPNQKDNFVGEIFINSLTTAKFKLDVNSEKAYPFELYMAQKDKIASIYVDERINRVNLGNFCRNLVKGEVDNDFYFSIASDKSCNFRLRLKLFTADNKILYTDYIYMRYLHPRNGVCIPQ